MKGFSQFKFAISAVVFCVIAWCLPSNSIIAADMSPLNNLQQTISQLTNINALLGQVHSLPSRRQSLLPSNQVYTLRVVSINHHRLVAQWQIAPGSYLYAKRIKIETVPGSKATIHAVSFPPAVKLQHNHFLGRIPVYRHQLHVPIEVESDNGRVSLLIHYQGCSDAGVCYPPMTQHVQAQLTPGSLNQVVSMSMTHSLAPALTHSSHAFFPGLVLAFFIVSALLGLSSKLASPSRVLANAINRQFDQSTKHALGLVLFYALVTMIVWLVGGLIVIYVGYFIHQVSSEFWVVTGSALLFFVAAMVTLGWGRGFVLRHHHQETMPGDAKAHCSSLRMLAKLWLALSCSLSLSITLVGVLVYAALTQNVVFSVYLTLAAGLGWVVPLVMLSLAGSYFSPNLIWVKRLRITCALFILAAMIAVLSVVLSQQITLLLIAALLIVFSIYCEALTLHHVTRWTRLIQVIGLIILICGVILAVGALSHHTQLRSLVMGGNSVHGQQKGVDQADALQIHRVTTLPALNHQLSLAKQEHVPAFVDFYASWCADCQYMVQHVYTDPQIIARLSVMRFIEVDLSSNDADSRTLEKHYGIYGPPDVMFYDSQGHAVPSQTVIGIITAKSLLQHLLNMKLFKTAIHSSS